MRGLPNRAMSTALVRARPMFQPAEVTVSSTKKVCRLRQGLASGSKPGAPMPRPVVKGQNAKSSR